MSREKLHSKIKEVINAHQLIVHGSQTEYIADSVMFAIDEYVREESEEPDPEAWRSLKEGDRVRVCPPPDDGVETPWLSPDRRASWKRDTRIGQTGTLDKDDGDGIPWVRWDNPERTACIYQFKLEKIDDEH